MCTDTPQRYLRRILVSDFKQTKRWPIIPSLRRCQCSPPPAYLSMCTDTPQRYLRRILILDFKQKNAGRPFSFQNRFSLLWQPCSYRNNPRAYEVIGKCFESMKSDRIMEKSPSPWRSAVCFITKGDGYPRWCLNCRNTITKFLKREG